MQPAGASKPAVAVVGARRAHHLGGSSTGEASPASASSTAEQHPFRLSAVSRRLNLSAGSRRVTDAGLLHLAHRPAAVAAAAAVALLPGADGGCSEVAVPQLPVGFHRQLTSLTINHTAATGEQRPRGQAGGWPRVGWPCHTRELSPPASQPPTPLQTARCASCCSAAGSCGACRCGACCTTQTPRWLAWRPAAGALRLRCAALRCTVLRCAACVLHPCAAPRYAPLWLRVLRRAAL